MTTWSFRALPPPRNRRLLTDGSTGIIEIHPDQPDKAAILAKNGNKIDKPERFNATAIYPGAILLVGDIVK